MIDRRTADMTAAFNKVPAVTLVFWIIKIVATTVGETAADVLSRTSNLGLIMTSVVMAVLLVIALIVQFRARTYVPTRYWITVVFISVVGTLISETSSTISVSRLHLHHTPGALLLRSDPLHLLTRHLGRGSHLGELRSRL